MDSRRQSIIDQIDEYDGMVASGHSLSDAQFDHLRWLYSMAIVFNTVFAGIALELINLQE